MTVIPDQRRMMTAPTTPLNGVLVTCEAYLQRIDGFGASNRDDPAPLTTGQADSLFSSTIGTGVGLSLLRTSIYVDGTDASGSYSDAGLAVARGARIMSTPWTAPAADKDNGQQNNGGHLLVADYSAWATLMAGYQANLFASQGVNVYAMGVQNEPDFSDPFDTMLYTTAEMNAFIKVLGPKLAALSPAPLLMMPEVSNWSSAWNYTAAIDGTAAPYVAIVGAHQYSGVSAPSMAPLVGLPIWQTEMSDAAAPVAFDGSIANGLTVAQWIHDALTTGQVSAWCYWGITGPANANNEALVGDGAGNFTLTKRLYVLGNWALFVRPGHYRVATSSTQPISGVYVTAFQNPATSKFVIVSVNQNASTQVLPIAVYPSNAAYVTPYVTSASASLAAQSQIGIAGGLFTPTLAASSVTSFVSN
jgi:glucuronoarabinoxylan endo-1,4-beta-xylanase